ncbi:mediator complex subunit 13 C-terminal-domain-containing protein [Elsinoe ampelina]|uniref:Mediator of RNA polymerase II transcription subunit 13 n=1 Tax=Elsinoe ampelina TaxID=302913 RepID=A0A6A6GPE7_9PEZI|nr:mediator complex subunit 13 C-terminal-domain-containing protein [Elsinoe ampelina]
MEFIRSCSSNTILFHNESSLEIKYDCYDLLPTSKSGEQPTHVNGTLRVLRTLGQLAAVDHDIPTRLWIFHTKGREDEAPELVGLRHGSTGIVNAPDLLDVVRQNSSNPPKPSASLFLEAFSAYTTQVLKSIGTVHHLGPTSWLLTPLHDDFMENGGSSVLSRRSLAFSITFRATSAASTAVCIGDAHDSNYQPLIQGSRPVEHGQPVVMAPTGIIGVASGIARQPRDVKLADEAWLWLTNKYHFLRQIDKAGSNQAWITVRLRWAIFKDSSAEEFGLQTPLLITWPACLCFVSPEEDSDTVRLPSFLDGDDLAGILDPIKEAERWFLGSADREQALKTAEISSTGPSTEPQLDGFDDDLDLSTSPVYNRNLDIVASNGVYPTPPDGILPAHNPTTTSSTHVIDMPTEEGPLRSLSSDHVSRKSSIDMNVEGLDDNDDNLFGDIDEDMFGNAEIDVTDADFNFFDVGAARGLSRQISPDKALPTTRIHDHELDMQHQYSAQQLADLMDVSQEPLSLPYDDAAPRLSNVPIPEIITTEGNEPLADVSDHDMIPTGTATPPLSPVLVKNQLFPTAGTSQYDNEGPATSQTALSRTFAPVSFQSQLANTSAKYKDGGRYANIFSSQSRELVPVTSKRNISLREYLEKPNEHLEARPKYTVTSIGLRALSIDDTDESDTDSVLSADARIQPASKRIAVAAEESDLNDRKVAVQNKQLIPSNGPALSVEVLERDLARCDRAFMTKPTHLHTFGLLARWKGALSSMRIESDENFWEVFDFEGPDFISVAQLVAEASINDWNAAFHQPRSEDASSAVTFIRDRWLLSATTLTTTKTLSLQNLATMSVNAIIASAEQAAKNGPRPTARRMANPTGGSGYGQQLFPLSAPFVRFRRADSSWDLLSSAINFWEALGLEPTHGPKNVSAEIITIGNDDLRDISLQFVQDVQYFYESCKFGNHSIGYRMHRRIRNPPDSPGSTLSHTNLVLSTMRDACIDLAKKLNHRSRQDGRKPVIVYLVSPFKDPDMIKFVCACFQSCFRELGSGAEEATLQLISYDTVAQSGGAIIPRTRQLIRLCMSIYDKIRPQKSEASQTPWKLFCAPSTCLVSPLPRKINFTLNETPPINLMQEAQVLHLAYAVSADARWVSVAWTDYTGNYQAQRSYCLYRADREAVFNAVKDNTASLISATATWRVIIACVGHSTKQERQIFASLNAPTVALAMVDVCLSPIVQIFPQPSESDPTPAMPTTPALAQGASSLTPASTPQAASTVSPDPHHPPTPSSTDPTSHLLLQPTDSTTPDPDAQLVDTRDESFALVLPFSTTQSPSGFATLGPQKKVLASGQLLKRGDAIPNQPLPSLGVDVMEVLPPKMAQGQQSWMMPRAPEYVLREVLAWYRGLGLLGKIRGIKGCEMGERPWHIGVVVAGGEGLVGFFD